MNSISLLSLVVDLCICVFVCVRMVFVQPVAGALNSAGCTLNYFKFSLNVQSQCALHVHIWSDVGWHYANRAIYIFIYKKNCIKHPMAASSGVCFCLFSALGLVSSGRRYCFFFPLFKPIALYNNKWCLFFLASSPFVVHCCCSHILSVNFSPFLSWLVFVSFLRSLCTRNETTEGK